MSYGGTTTTRHRPAQAAAGPGPTAAACACQCHARGTRPPSATPRDDRGRPSRSRRPAGIERLPDALRRPARLRAGWTSPSGWPTTASGSAWAAERRSRSGRLSEPRTCRASSPVRAVTARRGQAGRPCSGDGSLGGRLQRREPRPSTSIEVVGEVESSFCRSRSSSSSVSWRSVPAAVLLEQLGVGLAPCRTRRSRRCSTPLRRAIGQRRDPRRSAFSCEPSRRAFLDDASAIGLVSLRLRARLLDRCLLEDRLRAARPGPVCVRDAAGEAPTRLVRATTSPSRERVGRRAGSSASQVSRSSSMYSSGANRASSGCRSRDSR